MGFKESASDWVRRLGGMRDRTPDTAFPKYQITKVYEGGARVDLQAGTHKMKKIPVESLTENGQESADPVLGSCPIFAFERGDKQMGFVWNLASFLASPIENIGPWSCARGNSRGDFLAGTQGTVIPILTAPAPVKLDQVTSSGGIVGAVFYTLNGVDYLSIKNHQGTHSGDPSYLDEFYALPPGSLLTSPSQYLFELRVSDVLATQVYINTFSSWHYCEELGLLVLAKRRRFNETGELIAISAKSTTTGASIVSPTGILAVDFIADEGLVIAGKMLVKSHHLHSYNSTYTSDTKNANNKCVLGIALPGMTVSWAWDPNKIWNGTSTFPARCRLVSPAVVADPSSQVGNGQHSVDTSQPWPYGIGKSQLLPGNSAVYLPESKLIVLPVVGRKACDATTYTWSNPDFPIVSGSFENRTRPVEVGQQHVNIGRPNGFNYTFLINGGFQFGVNVGVLYPIVNAGASPTIGGMAGAFAQHGLFGASSNGVWAPYFGRGNSRKLRSWLVYLRADETTPAGGEVKCQFDLPELDASNPENYLIDTDSFDRVETDPVVTQLMSEINGYSEDLMLNTTPEFVHCTASATASSALVHPDQIGLAAYQTDVDGNDVLKTYDVKPGMGTLQDYLYWPPGASYLWDPMLLTQTGDNSTDQNTNDASGLSTNTNLAADVDENVYGVYLRPKLFVTCADIFHRVDESIADRTHSANPAWSTHLNGYAADRLTVKANKINFFSVVSAQCAPPNAHAATAQANYVFYGQPNKVVCFRSFLGCWNKKGAQIWEKELTSYHDERVDSSPGLAGKIPYPGCTLRLEPTSAGLFVLRLERLPIQTSIREAALLPRRFYANRQDFVSHTFNSRMLVELYDKNGQVMFQQVVFDPSTPDDLTPLWLCGCSMFASESPDGVPWVVGRVDYSTDYNAKQNWMDNPATHPGLARYSKIFTCTAGGVLQVRDAVANDLDSNGVWPHDFVAALGHENGLVRQGAPVLNAGTVYYPAPRVGSSGVFDLYAYGEKAPS